MNKFRFGTDFRSLRQNLNRNQFFGRDSPLIEGPLGGTRDLQSILSSLSVSLMKHIIGYIGLGQMGGAMAANLLENGFQLNVYDCNAKAAEPLKAMGAEVKASVQQVVADSDVVITSLPNPMIVEEVALGPEGIIDALNSGKIYIDMSTIDPDTSRKVGKAVKAKGASMLDVPVGRGPDAARSGKLILLIGGEKNTVAECQEALDVLGEKQFHCGEQGMGATVKLINNLVSCSINALNCEAFALGAAAGTDPQLLADVLTSTAADNFHLRENLIKKALKRDFSSVFQLQLAQKDLRLASQLAQSLHFPNLISSSAQESYTFGLAQGLGSEDQCSLVKMYESVTGNPVQ